jgi:hypothetical protein
MSPSEAVNEYIAALKAVGQDTSMYQFKVNGTWICLGRAYGPNVADVQWGMTWYTPEQFSKVAKMRRLDLGRGDPKSPN